MILTMLALVPQWCQFPRSLGKWSFTVDFSEESLHSSVTKARKEPFPFFVWKFEVFNRNKIYSWSLRINLKSISDCWILKYEAAVPQNPKHIPLLSKAFWYRWAFHKFLKGQDRKTCMKHEIRGGGHSSKSGLSSYSWQFILLKGRYLEAELSIKILKW